MNHPESKKHQSRSNRATSGAPIGGGAVDDVGGTVAGPLAGGVPRASDSPEGGAPVRGEAVPSPCAPAVGGTRATSPWWSAPSPGAPFAVQAPPGYSEWMYQQGGFMNMLQGRNVPRMNYATGSQLPQNQHLVGGIMSHSTTSPIAACSKGTPSPTGSPVEAAAQMGSQDKETIEVEDDDTIQNARCNARSNGRSIVRLNWSNEEDIRLVSAWLHCSIDPVDGNDRKADQYWSDVTSTYNSTTKCIRNRNQLKLRWERIKKPVTEFNGCYTRITKVHQSGMSDDQKMDQALQLYASAHSDKPFTMVHVWRILRHEQKWSAYVKKFSNDKDKTATPNPVNVVNVEDDPKQRPVGHKKDKEERNRKRSASEAISAIDQKLDKFISVSNKADKMAEVQENLANKKLEVAKLNHKAAQEQKKSKMLDLYYKLLCAPTSHLSEEAAAERTKALEAMTDAIFSKDT